MTGDRKRVSALKREALLAGKSTYYTGEPCVNSHLSPRFVSNGTCASCNAAGLRVLRKKNSSQISAEQIAHEVGFMWNGVWSIDVEKFTRAIEIARDRSYHLKMRAGAPPVAPDNLDDVTRDTWDNEKD
jgi:hypothetical protein